MLSWSRNRKKPHTCRTRATHKPGTHTETARHTTRNTSHHCSRILQQAVQTHSPRPRSVSGAAQARPIPQWAQEFAMPSTRITVEYDHVLPTPAVHCRAARRPASAFRPVEADEVSAAALCVAMAVKTTLSRRRLVCSLFVLEALLLIDDKMQRQVANLLRSRSIHALRGGRARFTGFRHLR